MGGCRLAAQHLVAFGFGCCYRCSCAGTGVLLLVKETASAHWPDCTQCVQIGLNAALHISTELHIATGCCGLLLGLLHGDALGDEAHPNLAGVEQAYSR